MPNKKSSAAVEKLIEAQARGKKVGGARNTKKGPRRAELDSRVSKGSSKFSIEID